MQVTIGVSNRHVHLTEEHLKCLFGEEFQLENIKDINQPGQFASSSKVTLKTEKDKIENVRVIGPIRPYTQIEISRTDSYKLGINPPVRQSGDLKGSAPITIIGPNGEINLEEGCIIADRHIHVLPEQAQEWGLIGKDRVEIKVSGEKGGIMSNVNVRVAEASYYEAHIDTDDANAHMLSEGDITEILMD